MSNLVTMSAMFLDCYAFNQPVTIPNSVKSCPSLFKNCYSLNRTVVVPDSIEYCYDMFYGCTNFNQPIHISNNAGNISNMFYNCRKFNQHLDIRDNVNCANMLRDCWSFNQPITIPSSNYASYTDNMLRNCNSLNQPVTMSNNKYPGNCMLWGCTNYNQPMSTLLGSNDYAPNSFSYLYSFTGFNYPVNASNLPNSSGEWFRNMICFNQPVNIPENCNNYYAVFENCYEFNQPVTILENAINVVNTFVNCRNFNQPIYIPESLLLKWDANHEYQTRTNLGSNGGIFKGCLAFNQQINFGGNYGYGHNYGRNSKNYFTINDLAIWYSGTSYNYPIPNDMFENAMVGNSLYLCNTFKNFYGFNQPLNLPNNTSLINVLWGCNNYCSVINIGDNSSIDSAFVGIGDVEEIRIGNNCSLYYLFSHFDSINRKWYGKNNCNFKGRVVIGDNATGYNALAFSQFNQDFVYKSSWNIAEGLFWNTPFNSNLRIENGCTEFSRLLYMAQEFNKPFNLPNSTINARALLYGCTKFNQPIDIPKSVISLESAFCLCEKFNQIVNLPENARLDGAFAGCSNYNSPIYLPEGASCVDILADCVNFNAEITINDNIGGAMNAPGVHLGCLSGAFKNCVKLNQTVRIPYCTGDIYSLRGTFEGCISQNSPIYVPLQYRDYYNNYINNSESIYGAIIGDWSEQAYSCIVWY